ncbi:cytochrome P450-dit2 [Basidiobolus ranarum]|uniref:Cytochrome P450-dit2 n=1 Tax=Basidiobolus ranarum TaxID=34480 RepID=A0ABR2WGG2_9FUNG
MDAFERYDTYAMDILNKHGIAREFTISKWIVFVTKPEWVKTILMDIKDFARSILAEEYPES